MDDRRISHGLALLADEADPPPVDVHAVIATAKARSRTRKLVGATGVATVAVVGALAVVVGFRGQEPTSVTPATQQTTTEAPATSEAPVGPVFDERAERLTEEVSAVMSSVAVPNVEISGLNHGQTGLGVPVFQGFAAEGRTDYQGVVDLTRGDGMAGQLQIWVFQGQPGESIDDPLTFPGVPCVLGVPTCSEHELADGTVVRVRADGDRHVVAAKRPDGTGVEVTVEPKTAGADLASLVDLDKLDLIVAAITY